MLRIRQTIFHPLFAEWSIDVEFQCREQEFSNMMQWLNCKYNEEFGVWYTADDSSCYEIIEEVKK